MKFIVLALLLACGWMAYQLLSRPKGIDNNASKSSPDQNSDQKPDRKNVEDLEQDPETGVYKSKKD